MRQSILASLGEDAHHVSGVGGGYGGYADSRRTGY
jgi:hypothetical protein